ncbi:hypothetical protein DFH06DRAFT_1340602 [Mycena polygramma]|nr:hypothetical protein DFH06DRAFT_1340602 [Mycena polygramma]
MRCRQVTEDGRCTCEDYDPPQDPMARSICRECEHGKSLHKPPPEGNGETAPVKGTVKEIFAAHSAKGLKDLKPLADYSTARSDALKGFRPEPEASTNKKSSKKGKGKAEQKAKGTPVKVVLLTEGIKNGKLKGSTKALSSVDVRHRQQFQCVVKDVRIDREWSHRDCSKHFAKMFPKAWAEVKEVNSDAAEVEWSPVAKEYQQLRVVPTTDGPPTGVDVLENKVSTKHGNMIYIALAKTVPKRVFKSWYTGPPSQEPSSDDEEGSITISDESSTASDAHVDSSNEEEMDLDPNPYGMPYEMRPNPSSSKRKLESLRNATFLESEVEEKPFKKQKLDCGKHRPTAGGSSGKQRDGLFLTADSDPEWSPSIFQPASIAGPLHIAPIAGPSSQPPFTQRRPRVSLLLPKAPSTNPPEVVSESPATKDESKKEECTSCRRLVSAPPKTVVARLEYPWDEEEILRRQSTHVNPWHPKYVHPDY